MSTTIDSTYYIASTHRRTTLTTHMAQTIRTLTGSLARAPLQPEMEVMPSAERARGKTMLDCGPWMCALTN